MTIEVDVRKFDALCAYVTRSMATANAGKRISNRAVVQREMNVQLGALTALEAFGFEVSRIKDDDGYYKALLVNEETCFVPDDMPQASGPEA